MESTQLHSLGCKVNTKSQGVDQSEEIKSTTKITDWIEIKEFASDEFILPSVKLRSTSELTPIFKDSINLSSESLWLEDNSHRDHSNTEDSNGNILWNLFFSNKIYFLFLLTWKVKLTILYQRVGKALIILKTF